MPYLSIATPLGADKLVLRRLRGEEHVSGLFEFALEMQSADPALDFSKILGKSATVTIELADGTKRYLNGIVGRFVQSGDAHYYAELRPWLWLLTMTADCRIWQLKNKTAIDIVTGLFTELGFTDYRNDTKGTYDPVEYCVQYNETAFAFVSRMLESAGVSYFFEHADGKHTLVLADDASAYKDCPGAKTVDYGTYGNWLQQNVVTSCEVEQNVIPSAYAVGDFGFETPSSSLNGTTTSKKASAGTRRLYEYPGGFAKKDPAATVARVRMEAHELPQKLLRGNGYCRAFFAGAKTTIQKHPRKDVNAAYVLTRIVHDAAEDGYVNEFSAIPADVPLRPPRVTRRPSIHGTQTAIVTGKTGEEIWTDKYGRVKVRFHWDQRKDAPADDTSCWIRVAQGWAGKSWGALFLPRIGQEVVVTFLDGDPDRPLITGVVYNAEQTVPYALPGQQTKSTIRTNSSKGGGGFNEIRFEDKKDAEEIFIQAQKDMKVTVLNNETLSVAGTRDVTVTKAETHTSKADYTLNVDGNLTIDVKGTVTIKSAADVSVEGANITSKAKVALNSEAAELTNKASGVLTIQGATVKIN